VEEDEEDNSFVNENGYDEHQQMSPPSDDFKSKEF
jgi:hypothetical protein